MGREPSTPQTRTCSTFGSFLALVSLVAPLVGVLFAAALVLVAPLSRLVWPISIGLCCWCGRSLSDCAVVVGRSLSDCAFGVAALSRAVLLVWPLSFSLLLSIGPAVLKVRILQFHTTRAVSPKIYEPVTLS